MTTVSRATADDLRRALALRYPEQSHALMFEVAPATGGGTRYADAVAVGLWRSHGHEVEGVEVKVSRGDWLAELKQPEKSDPVMRYCDRWWLACPAGMVQPDELPPTWGMLELNGGTLRKKVKAPPLQPVPLDRPFFASLCRRRAGLELGQRNAEFDKRLSAALAEERRRDEQNLSHRTREAESAVKLVRELEELTGLPLTTWNAHGLLASVQAVHNGRLIQHVASLRRAAEAVLAATSTLPAEDE